MHYDKVVPGVYKYISAEVFPKLSDGKEMAARFFVKRITRNPKSLIDALQKNTFFNMMSIVDENGDVDLDGIVEDAKEILSAKNSIVLAVPAIGNFAFTCSDIDKLHKYIIEG